jgi:hypothetical protein
MREGSVGEDLATRLWRADFSGITYKAVLGYQEAGDQDDDDALSVDEEAIGSTLDELVQSSVDAARAAESVDAARAAESVDGFEREFELKEGEAELSPAMLSLVDRIQGEDLAELHRHFIEVVHEAVSSSVAAESFSDEEVEKLFTRTLGLVLESGCAENLEQYGTMLVDLEQSAFARMATAMVDRGLSDEELLVFVGRAIERPQHDPEQLLALVAHYTGNQQARVAELADSADDPATRKFLRAALARLAGGDVSALVKTFRGAGAEDVRAAIEVLAHADQDRARQALAVRLAASEAQVQRELLTALCEIDGLYDHRMRGTLLRLVAKGSKVRAEILQLIRVVRDKGAVRQVAVWVKDDDFWNWDAQSIECALRFVLYMVADDSAVTLVEELLARRSLLKRRALAVVKVAAVRALAESRAEAAGELLARLGNDKDKALREASYSAVDERAGGEP